MATYSSPDGSPALESWIPNFSQDLNALRRAELALNIDQGYVYGEALALECRRDENLAAGDHPEKKFPFNGWGYFSLATMPASVKAAVLARLVEGWDQASVGA